MTTIPTTPGKRDGDNAPLRAGEIEALADSLSTCADELHQRIMKAIRQNPPGGPAPHTENQLDLGISHGAAQALFENEVALRQRANGLYVDAARLAVAGLGVPQRELLDIVAQARQRIRRITILKDLIEITADVLGLAAALAAGKPEQLLPSVKKIRAHTAQLRDDRAPLTPPPPTA